LIALILNVLWLIFGGLIAGIGWLIGGAILALTIVGLPWTFAAWRIAAYTFWPFGREVVWRTDDGVDPGRGPLGTVLNVIWFVFAGWWIALTHLIGHHHHRHPLRPEGSGAGQAGLGPGGTHDPGEVRPQSPRHSSGAGRSKSA